MEKYLLIAIMCVLIALPLAMIFQGVRMFFFSPLPDLDTAIKEDFPRIEIRESDWTQSWIARAFFLLFLITGILRPTWSSVVVAILCAALLFEKRLNPRMIVLTRGGLHLDKDFYEWRHLSEFEVKSCSLTEPSVYLSAIYMNGADAGKAISIWGNRYCLNTSELLRAINDFRTRVAEVESPCDDTSHRKEKEIS